MPQIDWLGLEGDYRAGVKSLRHMDAEYGVPQATIRHRAKKNGWVRDPTGTKRRIVQASLAGVAHGAAHCAMESIKIEAEQDIEDMSLGIIGARLALQRAVSMIALPSEEELKINPRSAYLAPKDLKLLSECVRLNIETLRMIRGLDDPSDGRVEDIDAEIEIELARLHANREARLPQTPTPTLGMDAAAWPTDNGLRVPS